VKDQAGILQLRIQVLAVGRGRQQAAEGVGGEQDEGQKAHADQPHHAQDAGTRRLVQVAREERHRHAPAAQNQGPQQDGALMPAPYAGNTVRQGQGRVGMLHHIQHGKIIAHEGMGQAGEGHRHEQALPARRRAGKGHPVAIATRRADERQHALGQRQHQGQHQGKLAQLGAHGRACGASS
jgi:hypothetical protein